MKRTLLGWIVLLGATLGAGCGNNGPAASGPLPDSATQKSEGAAPQPKADTVASEKAALPPPDTSGLRAGRHKLTLQWISWDRPGQVQLTPDSAGWYRVEGSQENNNGDYLRIRGRLRALSKLRLHFEGTIETRVASINGGAPCLREGAQEFRSTKGRQYWRLQQMINCEGGLVTDYIDIYF